MRFQGAPRHSWPVGDTGCRYPGRFLKDGKGSVIRGIEQAGTVSAHSNGDRIEVSLASEILSLEEARQLADYLRDLTLDMGSMYPSIALYSGAMYDFSRPGDNRISIEDVAHGLSNLCRFGGHCASFYSVAEHSVRASYIEPDVDAYAKLMHDTPESVMVDLPTPLKRMLRDYELLIDKVERNFAETFDYVFPLSEPVKHADLIILATEKRDLKPNAGEWRMLQGVPTLPEKIIPWSPQKARKKFLERYEELHP